MGRITTSTLVLAAVLLMLCGGVQAASTRVVGTPEVEQLRTAYMTLYIADHDYHGHRIKAMHILERACKLLGTDISGDGKGHERQAVSDAELTKAQAVITTVVQGNVVTGQPKVAKLLNKAIAEITTALKVH